MLEQRRRNAHKNRATMKDIHNIPLLKLVYLVVSGVVEILRETSSEDRVKTFVMAFDSVICALSLKSLNSFVEKAHLIVDCNRSITGVAFIYAEENWIGGRDILLPIALEEERDHL